MKTAAFAIAALFLTVATATENHYEAPVSDFTQSSQHMLKRIIRMRIIHEHLAPLSSPYFLETPRYAYYL